jgi:hypothetical protein
MTHTEILDSKYGSELLAFLLLAPPRSFSLKELSKRLQISERALSPVLDEFEDDNMIKMFTRGNTRLYIVNQKHKLLPEIKNSLVKNQKAYEDELFGAITKLGDVKAAFLSGAFVGQPQLPVDLLVVGKANTAKLETFLKQCKVMLGIDLNYSIMSPEEFKLRKDTFDRFLKDIFDYPHLVVVDNLAKSKKPNKR